MKNIIVIGGGAAGMMAAISAASAGLETGREVSVKILEKNEKLGKKVFITGKGRCNLTNGIPMEDFFDKVISNKKFLYGAFASFTNQDIIDLMEEEGTKVKEERGNRIFPVSDHSSDVIGALKRRLNKLGVEICNHTCVKEIVTLPYDSPDAKGPCQKVAGVILEDGRKLSCDSLILATGGKSYPVTGSSGDGYRFAKKLGIELVDTYPALVPITVKEEDAKDLQGLALKNVELKLSLLKAGGKEKILYENRGEMLFAHFGLTGPLVLSASSYVAKEFSRDHRDLKISLDLKPALSFEQLDKRLLREFEENQNRNFSNSLDRLLPKTMIPFLIERSGLSPYKKVNLITKEEREGFVDLMKNLCFSVSGLRGFNEAIITQGGIKVKEVNPKTMEVKKVKDLYVAGEVLDLDAVTGGFNLQIAWSTGYVAGRSALLSDQEESGLDE